MSWLASALVGNPSALYKKAEVTTLKLTLSVLALLALLLSGCPLFKSNSIKERELRHAPKTIELYLGELEPHYPHLVELIKARWRKARPAYDRALKVENEFERVDALEAALEPVTEPLYGLRSFERSHADIHEKLRTWHRAMPAKEKARFSVPADKARRTLIAARPSDGGLAALIRAAERAQNDRYFRLQNLPIEDPRHKNK